jgi:hypothetical protein
MDERGEKVGSLKKISVLLEAGMRSEVMDLTREPIPYDFVYGVGTHGLSPFEFELSEKREGDEIIIPLRTDEMANFFCHHVIPQLGIPEGVGEFYLRALIAEISAADPRDIIRAMAEASACRSGCCGH